MGTSKENPDVSDEYVILNVFDYIPETLVADPFSHHLGKTFHHTYHYLKCVGEASPAQGSSPSVARRRPMARPHKNPSLDFKDSVRQLVLFCFAF